MDERDHPVEFQYDPEYKEPKPIGIGWVLLIGLGLCVMAVLQLMLGSPIVGLVFLVAGIALFGSLSLR